MVLTKKKKKKGKRKTRFQNDDHPKSTGLRRDDGNDRAWRNVQAVGGNRKMVAAMDVAIFSFLFTALWVNKR